MFNMMHEILIIYFALPLGVNCEELQCSKFHYEAQTLEKMIRMEVKVDAMEKEIVKTNQLVLESLEALTAERQAVKAERELLEREYADLKEAVKEDLKNTRVAFKARGPADKSIETGQTVVFSTNMLNEGGAYDNTIGIFTVPVAGTYLFTIHLCVGGGNNFYYGIVYDNIVYTSGRFYDSAGTICYTADAILVLQPGQKVLVKSLYGSTTDVLYEFSFSSNNYWNTFYGVLIHK